jgi:hypothetical protein
MLQQLHGGCAHLSFADESVICFVSFVIPKDAAELDRGFHNFSSTPQKAQKEQMCFKKCCARFLLDPH